MNVRTKKPMCTKGLATACFLISTSTPVSASEGRLYWPAVAVETHVEQSPGQRTSTGWRTTLAFFNTASVPAGFRVLRTFGDIVVDEPCRTPGVTFPPRTGVQFRGRCFAQSEGLAYVELATDAGMVANGEVELTKWVWGCYQNETIDVGLGRSGIPLYTSIFPAGSTVILGEVDLGQPNVPPQCRLPDQTYLRRVNLTMLNTGTAPAHFHVDVLPVNTARGDKLAEFDYALAAGQVFQANRLPIPVIDDAATGTGAAVQVWLVVSADQPYLCYASSIFETEETGTMPFEVFPARLAQ